MIAKICNACDKRIPDDADVLVLDREGAFISHMLDRAYPMHFCSWTCLSREATANSDGGTR